MSFDSGGQRSLSATELHAAWHFVPTAKNERGGYLSAADSLLRQSALLEQNSTMWSLATSRLCSRYNPRAPRLQRGADSAQFVADAFASVDAAPDGVRHGLAV
ncbi:hypothetical protein ON010_g19111 [Phytophthora cinnamomi]|nr:hypothetical protein ON010_g19111 [Phytophthora cinnamomi]